MWEWRGDTNPKNLKSKEKEIKSELITEQEKKGQQKK